MRNDAKIKDQIKKMAHTTSAFLDYTEQLNQCAYTDRLIETLLAQASELKDLYDTNDMDENPR